MAYNLRTGLIGSGDIDVNVSLSGLTADNITSGVFGLARIPTLDNSKISALDAAKLTGTLSADRIAAGSIAKDRVNEAGAWAETEIPTLPKSKIDPNHDTQWAVEDIPNLDATKITTGAFASSDRIPTLPSSKIDSNTTFAKSMINTAGEWPVGDIPDLPASKITSGTFAKSKISTAETWPLADIPNLPATKIASGLFDAARIPDLSALKIQSDTLNAARIPELSATKITSDTLNAARIPNLDASKITTGTISSARLPATVSDCLMLRGLMAAYGASVHSKTITTTYAALASQTNGSFTAPASGMVVVTLTFYLVCAHDKAVLARLVKGGTTTEFTSAYSLNSSGITCQETDNVYVVKHTTADSADTFDKQVQVTWLLTGLSSGSTYAVDAHMKTGAGTATAKWGDYGSVNHPPILFEVRSIPNSVANVVISEGSGG